MSGKSLNGLEVASYIKQRHMDVVRSIPGVKRPVLAVVNTDTNPVTATYLRIKQAYGADIGVDVEIHQVDSAQIVSIIEELNKDPVVSGIIVQLPLVDTTKTDIALNSILPEKDVDGLRENSPFDPATPTAILWLLSAYGVELAGKNIVLVGEGRLVGKPLATMLQKNNISPVIVDEFTEHPDHLIQLADVIISAVGKSGIVKSAWIKPGAVVVDAGVVSEGGVFKGDVEDIARERDDIAITPLKGGVGPLTVCALFENLLRHARA